MSDTLDRWTLAETRQSITDNYAKGAKEDLPDDVEWVQEAVWSKGYVLCWDEDAEPDLAVDAEYVLTDENNLLQTTEGDHLNLAEILDWLFE